MKSGLDLYNSFPSWTTIEVIHRFAGDAIAMVSYAIIELEDGLTIATVEPGQSAEDAAVNQGGTLIDEGPFATYEEAYDAMLELESEDEEDARQ